MQNPLPPEVARQWDDVYRAKFNTMWYPHEDIVRFCTRYIQKRLTYDSYDVKRRVERVLDLGCGNGRHVVMFARQGFQVSGIDISERAIEWAAGWCRREGLSCDLRVGDIAQLPYADASFDVVVTHGVLDHVRIEQAQQAVSEVHRALKPGGLFYCDLRSTEDFECGTGEEVEPHTYLLKDGFEAGLVQHFFSLDEAQALLKGLFRILNIECSDRRIAPDFTRRYSRWAVASERV